MKFIQRVLGRNRVRAARQRLARTPSPMHYAALARECVQMGLFGEARSVCEEGLRAFPGSTELRRLAERASRVEREERMAFLKKQLRQAPRPALWKEMCEILLGGGMASRAEEHAREWLEATDEAEAMLMLGRVQVERYLADRGREEGRKAFDTLQEVQTRMPRDPRPWQLRVRLASAIGAWGEARRCAAQLLGMNPGNPEIEACFRTLDSMTDGAPSIDKALLRVERTGNLAEQRSGAKRERKPGAGVRPALRQLAGEDGVRAAIYMRGGTALVQGTKGATAERTARAVRSILQSTRKTARRLGLGQVSKVQIEGGFGLLAIAPGDMDAGALWCQGPMTPEQEAGLMYITGLDVGSTEDKS